MTGTARGDWRPGSRDPPPVVPLPSSAARGASMVVSFSSTASRCGRQSPSGPELVDPCEASQMLRQAGRDAVTLAELDGVGQSTGNRLGGSGAGRGRPSIGRACRCRSWLRRPLRDGQVLAQLDLERILALNRHCSHFSSVAAAASTSRRACATYRDASAFVGRRSP